MRIRILHIAATSLLALAAYAGALEISNEHLKAEYNVERGALTVTAKDTGATFINGSWSTRKASSAKVVKAGRSCFGNGKAIELAYADGRVDRISLYEDVDFLFIQPTMANKSDEEINVEKVDLVEATLELGKPVESLVALGTAGLTGIDEHPGSYMFLSIADPETRNGVVGAWLSSDRGSGIVFSGADEGKATLSARIDYGRLRIKPGKTAHGEIFIIGHFEDVRLGLEKYADLVAEYNDIKLLPQLDGYCTWYSRPHGGASDEERIIELSEFAARELKPYGFDFVQIDDKWQEGKRRNGPANVFDRVNPDGPYKGGMKPVADKIVDMGLVAGIWWMPFAGDHEDPFFADKLHWFTKKPDGSPYHARWGGTALDMTNPEAMDYVAFLANRMANEWGYKYFKMDGMWMGTSTCLLYVNNGYKDDDLGTPKVHNPDMTPIEAHRAGLKRVREAAGRDVFFLGCCVSQNMRSFGGSFGTVDAMRVGPDNGSSWKGLVRGPWHGSNRYFLHRRVWYNDPDPIYVRGSMPIEHAQLITTWVAISGQLRVSSEWFAELPEDRIDLLRRTMPSHDKFARPVDLLETDSAKIWLLQDDSSGVQRNVIGLYNWSESEPDPIEYSMAKLGLDPEKKYVGFDYWNDRFVPPFSKTLSAVLQPGSCLALSLRECEDDPVVVSTSRHITQGIVDILEEEWNAGKGVLSGRSELVANDPYEIRIVVPTGDVSWKLGAFKVGARKAKVVSKSQNGPIIRVKIVATESGEVDWSAQFEKAAVEATVPASVTGLKSVPDVKNVTLLWTPVKECSYRITRNDGKVITSGRSSIVDSDIKGGKTYTYKVSALGWDGTASNPVEITVTTRERPERPPLPPSPEVSISTLKAVQAKNGYRGPVRTNKSFEDKPLSLDGKRYKDGMGVHANALLVYKIPEGSKRFVALVGLDDEKKHDPRASVVFEVYGDVKEMGEPPVLLGKSPVLSDKTLRTWCFDVELSDRHREVRLVVTDAGDGIACDHADWVNAGFLK